MNKVANSKNIIDSIISDYEGWDDIDGENFQLYDVKFVDPSLQQYNGCVAAFIWNESKLVGYSDDVELFTKQLSLSIVD